MPSRTMTAVARLGASGILRLGRPKTGFRYRYAGGGKPGRGELARIRALRIPPAWSAVAIDRSPRAAIQAVGQDSLGRWQYLYSEGAVARREREKARRLIAFTRALPRLRQRVAHDLNQDGLGRERVLAAVLRILSTCFLRSGSDEYASENGSYGISTLRARHVQVRGSRIRLKFKGKSGKEQDCEIDDRRAARVVRTLLALPGARLFRFRDEEGELRVVRRQHINAYIKEAMGEAFTAKDFRTWAGTVLCACALSHIGRDADDTPAARRRKVVAAVKETATTLGNTPAVCRSSYISPRIIDGYEHGRVLEHRLVDVAVLARQRGGRLHSCERALLRLLESS